MSNRKKSTYKFIGYLEQFLEKAYAKKKDSRSNSRWESPKVIDVSKKKEKK